MISIILPAFNEQDNIKTLYKRLAAVAETLPDNDLEFIFIDDCSRDNTPQILSELSTQDERVKFIRFARNCGSHAAVAAGLRHCSGDVAIILASDLQDPPEIIPRLLAKKNEGYNVVWGVREQREGESFVILVCSRIFYYLMNKLTDVSQSSTGADVFLVDRSVIDSFNESPEKHTSVLMLIAWLGYKQATIKYVKETRLAGASKWTTTKRLKLFFDSLVSFSYAPLRMMSLLGVTSSFLGMVYSFIIFFNAHAGKPIQGWSSLMVVILFLGGFQMIMMGMLGEYLWRAYDETRGRPRYVIEKNTLSNKTSAGHHTES